MPQVQTRYARSGVEGPSKYKDSLPLESSIYDVRDDLPLFDPLLQNQYIIGGIPCLTFPLRCGRHIRKLLWQELNILANISFVINVQTLVSSKSI